MYSAWALQDRCTALFIWMMQEILSALCIHGRIAEVTHFYNLKNGLVPENAVVFCTIHDYIAMQLAGNTVPITDASDAASFGVFQVEQGRFDKEALNKAGIDPTMLPILAEDTCIGQYNGIIPVYVAIGDNQASFFGATDGDIHTMLGELVALKWKDLKDHYLHIQTNISEKNLKNA